jgi:hypothetical protein
MRGEASTFATVMMWDEATFDYQRIMLFARQQDARAEYLALHDPPLLIVCNVRFDREVTRP